MRPRKRRQRGASIVEAALVTPVFFLALFGIIEIGFLFRDYLTVSNAASQGARSASVAGNAQEADFLILETIAHGIDAMGVEAIDFVVVYNANTNTNVPSSCNESVASAGGAGGIPGVCNVYVPGDFGFPLNEFAADGVTVIGPSGYFGCDMSGGPESPSIDTMYCPLNRKSSITGVGPDYVGVYVESTHSFITGFFQDSVTLRTNKIVRIEPTLN